MPTMYKSKKIIILENFPYTKNGWFGAYFLVLWNKPGLRLGALRWSYNCIWKKISYKSTQLPPSCKMTVGSLVLTEGEPGWEFVFRKAAPKAACRCTNRQECGVRRPHTSPRARWEASELRQKPWMESKREPFTGGSLSLGVLTRNLNCSIEMMELKMAPKEWLNERFINKYQACNK